MLQAYPFNYNHAFKLPDLNDKINHAKLLKYRFCTALKKFYLNVTITDQEWV